MALDSTQYRDAMLALLPQGAAWPKHPNSDMGKLFQALSYECERIEKRAESLHRERSPFTTIEMLPEWLADWGLPDNCMGDSLSTAQLRDMLIAKVTTLGCQSKQFFTDFASQNGYDVSPITEYTQADQGTASGFNGDDWNFIWQVTGPTGTVKKAQCGSAQCGDPFVQSGDSLLDCLLQNRVHTHRKLLIKVS